MRFVKQSPPEKQGGKQRWSGPKNCRPKLIKIANFLATTRSGMYLLTRWRSSTLWRTVSAASKAKLANSLASGDADAVWMYCRICQPHRQCSPATRNKRCPAHKRWQSATEEGNHVEPSTLGRTSGQSRQPRPARRFVTAKLVEAITPMCLGIFACCISK